MGDSPATLLGIGLYGVLVYSLFQRPREIGVRLAVGAQRQDIEILFARESFVLVLLLGLAFGGPAALSSVRILKNLLSGGTTTDMPVLFTSLLALTLAVLPCDNKTALAIRLAGLLNLKARPGV